MTVPAYRGRFAPSPTGPLHYGSLYAAFGSWLLARHHAGEWWVRVEDIDPPREVPGAAQAQLRTLAAFGLVSDAPVVRQSERHDLYAAALAQLIAAGSAFACTCSRSELAADAGIHHRCLHAPDDRPPAWRLRVSSPCAVAFNDGLQGRVTQDVYAQVGDFVLKRADGYWAYQLAVVVDDAAQGMSDVVRGADLLDSTPRQILLQQALGLPTPNYLHLPLVVDAQGRKLSKSEASRPLDDADPLPALRLAWRDLGQDPRRLPASGARQSLLAAAVAGFDPARLPRRLPAAGG